MANFELTTDPLPALADGEVLIRNHWMSVDPYMRGRMNDVPSYIEPFQIGEPLSGSATGEVIASSAENLSVGTIVSHFAGWRDFAVVPAAEATPIDPSLAPEQTWLGALGTPGLTAYLAVKDTAPVQLGDTVFISSAAGAVGSVAGQVARSLGAAKVIGSTGGADKATMIRQEFGFDAALDYRAPDLLGQLQEAAPNGIDVYVDSVGGDHLAAALEALSIGGRIAAVGAIQGYNATTLPPGPNNLYHVITKRLSMRGLLVLDHLDRFGEWISHASPMLNDGSLRQLETTVEGLENAPEAFLDLFRGRNRGKMLVKL